MPVVSLSSYVEDLGYCRGHFRSIIDSDARDKHRKFIEDAAKEIRVGLFIEGYWICWNDECIDCPILFKKSIKTNGTTVEALDDYAKTHLVSSVIKNVFLPEGISNRLKGNMSVYIYYYHAMYNSIMKLNKDELTEAVVFSISETIKTMSDKELTLYRSCMRIPDYKDILRLRLNMERTVNKTRQINLRG